MHKRPSLKEALSVLTKLSSINDDCAQALLDYKHMKTINEFDAARMVVDIVDHYNHIIETQGLVFNG